MRDIAGNVGTALVYNLLNLSLQNAIHGPINGAALAARTTATLVNTWIITPAIWFLIGITIQTTTYVVKKTANGVYSLFIPAQEQPLLMIEDRKPEVTPVTA